ncbi:hypothetical protein D9M68_641400 [compost metagenome]
MTRQGALQEIRLFGTEFLGEQARAEGQADGAEVAGGGDFHFLAATQQHQGIAR